MIYKVQCHSSSVKQILFLLYGKMHLDVQKLRLFLNTFYTVSYTIIINGNTCNLKEVKDSFLW